MNLEDFWQKFSPNGQRILASGQKIANDYNSGFGSEHLLMALSNTPNNLAGDLLRSYQISIQQIHLGLTLFTKFPAGQLGQELKATLELAIRKAVSWQHYKVEPEHLLLAIATNPDCRGYQILRGLGVEPDIFRQEIENIFEQIKQVDHFVNRRYSQGQPVPVGGPEKTAEQIKKTPALDYFATDLTQQAKGNKLEPVIGRDMEIERVIQILCRKTKNNPVLTGEPGVGKTAIVEGLAQKLAKGEVPTNLANKRLMVLDMTLILAGAMYRGQFEERIKKVIDEIIDSGQIILFIDEIHTIVGAGAAEGGAIDAANILKPALAKGQLRLIGATTYDEYRKFIEKDSALERRLQKVDVNQPSIEETIAILHGLKKGYESYHQVEINDEAIAAASQLSERYISDRFLPDKAIDLLDEAAAAVHIYNSGRGVNGKTKIVDAEAISKIVSQWTKIPLENLRAEEKQRLKNLPQRLKLSIISQNEAVDEAAAAIQRAKAGISDSRRPLGSFIFLGPTGVGKTELAKTLAKEVFGSEEAMIKIDMSEFMERHNISRLVGAPPGYVGYEESGKLTEIIRQRPYSLILLDEIEKAHPEVFNLLLQILEDGYLTDAKGRRVNFRNTIIIMTSNLGMAELTRQAAIGFQTDGQNPKTTAKKQYEEMKERVLAELKQNFRPEFINRLDKIIVFQPLDEEAIKKITQLQLDRLIERLAGEGIKLSFNQSVINHIAQNSFEPQYGARPIRRTITDLIENPIAELILANKNKPKNIKFIY
ncbi:MAG: ATP-dependent Clp protease ATP-binding subunit ClpC [Candidatus Berkelbacteria bacterium Licking1014_2]|uniref:ATP-dependent Clp protease ATP-binding subunit ClpC n=1 Tax=Candidatus Berkelbacteria bacterium Licking1014_2 TaxID=2017146 RepID=A0A554LUD4_9BACT|nr:MAG: ATP-dependent Clp protease ATP-binding subunit ClpC [Candidatus Berkelbacteria bacterium Licking1014_2]